MNVTLLTWARQRIWGKCLLQSRHHCSLCCVCRHGRSAVWENRMLFFYLRPSPLKRYYASNTCPQLPSAAVGLPGVTKVGRFFPLMRLHSCSLSWFTPIYRDILVGGRVGGVGGCYCTLPVFCKVYLLSRHEFPPVGFPLLKPDPDS